MRFREKHGSPGIQRQQGGAYAVEYAIVFPIFFMLLYGTLAYGTIFSMRLGLQHAAEEGARAALRYQQTSEPEELQITLREAAAEAVALTRASWMSSMGTLNVAADICPVSVECLPTLGNKLSDDVVCGETFLDGCQVVVAVNYPYASQPIFPSIPGLGLIFPENIQGRARLLVDGRALGL